MNVSVEKFNLWIKKHKLFALSAPIIILLTVFFVSASMGSLKAGDVINGEYNDTLPDQKKELVVKKPNELYKKSRQDSLDALREKGLFKSIIETKKANDSLEQVLEDLNNFSFDTQENTDGFGLTSRSNAIAKTPEYVSKKTAAHEKLEYRKLLMEARDERLSRSQDYSAPYSETTVELPVETIRLNAAIYRDQFVLPGNRVALILTENAYYKGNTLLKNTFVYAICNVQGSRVLLEIESIKNLRLPLMAMDEEDKMAGLHNVRAGELLREFNADVHQQGINEISEAAGESLETPLARNLIRSFGNFFKKKRYKQKDKILLVNGDRVFLVPKI